MFREFVTVRNENVMINVLKILMIFPTKRGSELWLEDGTNYEVKETYQDVCACLRFCTSGFGVELPNCTHK